MELGEIKNLLHEVKQWFDKHDNRLNNIFDATNENTRNIEQLRRDYTDLRKYFFWLCVVNAGLLFWTLRQLLMQW
jgi:hypothetical protein